MFQALLQCVIQFIALFSSSSFTIPWFSIFWFFRKHLEKQQKKLAQKGIQVDVDTLRREYLVQRGLLSPEEAGGDSNLGHR
jgi:hypothetical protein